MAPEMPRKVGAAGIGAIVMYAILLTEHPAGLTANETWDQERRGLSDNEEDRLNGLGTDDNKFRGQHSPTTPMPAQLPVARATKSVAARAPGVGLQPVRASPMPAVAKVAANAAPTVLQ